MDWFTATILTIALAAAVTVVGLAVRRPILFRMAARNAVRRPKQTATVIAGLMIGTAIISSALVAGDSARGAIRSYVYQSLGEVDESVAILAYPYFPEAVYDELRAAPAVQSTFDAVAPMVIWQGAGQLERTGQAEPEVTLVGYDPQADAAFGAYTTPGGGETDGRALQHHEAIASQKLADALGLQVGDTLEVTYTDPIDPILPKLAPFNGTLGPGASFPGLPGLPGGSGQPGAAVARHAVTVAAGATLAAFAVGWDPTLVPGAPAPLPASTQLHARFVDPQGRTTEATMRQAGNQTVMLALVRSAPDATLARGNWTLEVNADASLQTTYRGVALVGYPVYDLALLQERARTISSGIGQFQDLVPGLDVFSDPKHAQLRIVAITDGGRGSLFDFRNPVFLRMDDAQELFGRQGQVNLIKLSNPGDRVDGEDGTDHAMEVLNATLATIKARHPDLPAVQSLEAKPLKRDFLARADAKGQTLTGLLVFAGSLSIITGLLLILNIFTMLAEERRSELGMARAIGLGRGDLVRLFLFEGSLYAVAAAAIGSVLGLGLAFGMISVMNAIIRRLSTGLSFPPIEFHPSWSAVLVAFSLGCLLTFATILAASRRTSRLNVVRAIRHIEEPEAKGGRGASLAGGVPLAALGLAAGLAGWVPAIPLPPLLAPYRFTLQVAGALLVTLGVGLILRPRVARRQLAPALAAALASYYAASYFLIGRYTNQQEANLVGPVRGVILTLCVVVLVVHFEAGTRFVGSLMRRIKSLRAVAIPAVSYPLHRKFRTGMTLAMFSVVLLSIGFFSIFGALFQVNPERHTGGFDIEARATLTVPSLEQYGALPSGIRDVVQLPEYRTEDRSFITVGQAKTGTFKDYRHIVYGYDEAFVLQQRFRLMDRIPEYADDAAAYRGVLAHPDQVIVSYIYSTNEDGQALIHKAGDLLQMHLGNQTKEYVIAGIMEQYHYPGIFLPADAVRSLFPGAANVYLFHVTDGVDATQAAKDLESRYRAVGLDAKATLQEVLDEQASFRQLLGAMKLFLGLGLLVGVLSLGIITSRSVLERRQEIGMLRALGFRRAQVRLVFFIEVTVTILLGALVGIACAVLVTYGLWFAIIRELDYPYVVPWGEIAILVAISYAVAMLATAAPIGRSAKVAPAEALRYLE